MSEETKEAIREILTGIGFTVLLCLFMLFILIQEPVQGPSMETLRRWHTTGCTTDTDCAQMAAHWCKLGGVDACMYGTTP